MRDGRTDSPLLPPYRGMGGFLGVLQDLTGQPRRRRVWLPVVLLQDPEGDTTESARVAPGLREWLGGSGTPLARLAYLDGSLGEGPLAPFDEIARQLADTTRRRGEGRLRLPRLWLLATVARCKEELEADATAAEGVDGRVLRDRCYAEYRKVSRPSRLLWDAAGHAHDDTVGGALGLLWHMTTAWFFQWLPRWWFGVRARRRLAWLTAWGRAQQGRTWPGPFSVFACALDLVPGESAAGGPGAVRERLYRVLAQALLLDMESALNARLRGPWRRRRRTRFVLLFASAGDKDSREQQLVRELRTWAESERHTCAVVVATGVRTLAERLDDSTVQSVQGAVSLLESSLHKVPAESGIVVRLPPGPAENEAEEHRLGLHRRLVVRAPRWGPRGDLSIGAAAVAVVGGALVLAGLAGALPLLQGDPCDGGTFLSRDGRNCVGLLTRDSTNSDVASVLDEIFRENEDVEAAADRRPADDPGPSPRTVVYIGTLSGAASALDPVLGGTLAELRGLMLAQRLVNDQAGSERVPLRIEIADAGRRFQDAPAVAERIVDLAEEDGSVVGVVGMGQSRDTTYRALDILSAAGLPVIGTSGTADELLNHGGHYYQLSPSNSRMAAVLARFAESAALFRAGGGTFPAERVVMVADPRDAYSAGLAGAFQDQFTGDLRTLLYDAPDPVPDDEESGLAGEEVGSQDELAREVCDAVADEERTALVWTARGSEIRPFLDALYRYSGDCARLTLLGSDEVTNARVSESHPWDSFPNLSLYFVVNGAGPLLDERQGEAVSPDGRYFHEAYHAEFEDGGEGQGDGLGEVTAALASDPHPALAWDALRYLSAAVDQAWITTGRDDARLDRDLVQGVLYQGLGGGGFEGSTGRSDASGVENGRETPDKLVLVVHADPERPATAELVCGAVNLRDVRRDWGPGGAYRCPGADQG
ncbi:ABC transporter substrate-binding protein [Streptomyces avicenniae]|uniref:ABC transporter substrate-binding protein n=1 Tax=Streptomyces avicenniae TaxID=500153 RepID=UPI000B13E5EB|nr:ABC transporter substrate-binding protein [Streptomyces avicenniae]